MTVSQRRYKRRIAHFWLHEYLSTCSKETLSDRFRLALEPCLLRIEDKLS